MKDWKIDYTVRFKNGKEKEYGRLIPAEDIFEATEKAKTHIEDMKKCNTDIDRIVLWAVGIVQMDVF